jgi:hypothetical protein
MRTIELNRVIDESHSLKADIREDIYTMDDGWPADEAR